MISFKTFKTFINESVNTPSSPNPDMSLPLWNFLSGLSSPSDPTTYSDAKKWLNEETVSEAKITIDHRVPGSIVRSDSPAAPETAHKSMKLPKSSAMIAQGNRLIPRGTKVHKIIHDGFKEHAEEIGKETPEESKRKLRESKKVMNDFFKQYGYKKAPDLLNENGKTRKSTGEGVHTKGLALAPHTTNGLKDFDVCPRASSECRANCLGTEAGGNRQFPDTALSSKIAKTHFLATHPKHFARVLAEEIRRHAKKASEAGYIPAVRLNVTSDIAWEHHARHIMERHLKEERHPVQFYDYTKLDNRVGHPNLPKNYHLTLSHTGTGHAESNDKHVVRVLKRGGSVAMVYRRGSKVPKPTHVRDEQTGNLYPIRPGDKNDNTFDRHAEEGLTPGHPGHGVVSGLRLKGASDESAGHFANEVGPDGIISINKG